MSYVQRRKFLGAVLFALMALLAVAANATTLARMRFGELAHQATAVARLRCVGTQSFWEHGEIWTETRFAVVEQSKGSLPEFIRVRTIGGIVGNLHSRVEEVPTFRVGEEAYVFLWGRDGEPFRVLGWSQGTFESGAIRGRVWKPSRKIPRLFRSLIPGRASSATAEFAICRWRFFS